MNRITNVKHESVKALNCVQTNDQLNCNVWNYLTVYQAQSIRAIEGADCISVVHGLNRTLLPCRLGL